MVFPSPLNTVKTDDRCVNGWSVPVGVLMVIYNVYMVCGFPPPQRGHTSVRVTHPYVEVPDHSDA